jgi:3-oxoacyl-(acyl-carrier-protein) synthase
MVSPLGLSAEESWAALLDGGCGVRALREEDFPEEQAELAGKMPSQVVACIDRRRYQRQLEEAGEQVLE